jgi:hypothetical protein
MHTLPDPVLICLHCFMCQIFRAGSRLYISLSISLILFCNKKLENNLSRLDYTKFMEAFLYLDIVPEILFPAIYMGFIYLC